MASCIMQKNLMNAEESPERAEIDWLNRLDAIDPFFGDHDAIDALVASAPTLELASWLAMQVEDNRQFSAQLFRH